MIISVNGVDRIGKTQQANLLGKDPRLTLTGKLIYYSNRWPKVSPISDFTWWFRDVPFEEFVSVIIESIRARDATCTGNGVYVHDRGSRMFRAVCAATLIVRRGGSISDDDAVAIVDKIFDAELGDKQDDVELYFVPDTEYRVQIEHLRSISERMESVYLPWQTQLYEEYQQILARITERYFSERGGNVIRIRVNGPIVEIQNRVRKELAGAVGLKLEPLCEGLSMLIALGGLSESGKSGFAIRLSEERGFYRLKIKYFGEVVRKHGLPVHAETIGREILNFLHDHQHVRRASVESLHGDDLPAYLKLLFGDRFKTVFLDTPEDVRISRTVAASKLDFAEVTRRVREKDAVKIAGGGGRVKEMADIVHQNDKPFDESFTEFCGLLKL